MTILSWFNIAPFVAVAVALAYAVWVDVRSARDVAEAKAELARVAAAQRELQARYDGLLAVTKRLERVEREVAQQRARADAALQELRRRLAGLSDEVRRSSSPDEAVALVRQRLRELSGAKTP
jgi:septal ring factor EnvC (AmiA/AmiB activator)